MKLQPVKKFTVINTSALLMSIVIVSRRALSTMGTYRMHSQNGNEKRYAITIQIKKTSCNFILYDKLPKRFE